MTTLRDLAPGLPTSTSLGDLAPGTPGLRAASTPTNYGPDNEQIEREIAVSNMNQIEKGYRSSRISDKANWLANQEAAAAAMGDTAKATSLRNEITGLQREAAFYAPREQDVTQLDWNPGRILDWAGGAIGSTAASVQDGLMSGAALRGAAAVTGFIPHPIAQAASRGLSGLSVAVPFATNYLSNAGETYNEMANDKELMARTTAGERFATGAGAGLVMGALDTFGDVSLLRRGLGGTTGSKAVDTMLDGGGFMARTARDSAIEGGTEVLQTGVQKGAQALLNPNRDTSGDAADYWNALAQGAVGSAPLSGAGNAVQSVRETLQNRLGEQADKDAGSKKGDEIDLKTGKTISGADAPGEDIVRAATTTPTHRFTPEQQGLRDLLDGNFEVPDDPTELMAKTHERMTALGEELTRRGADPKAQQIMAALDAVDVTDPLANEHPALKAAADFVRPYAGLSEEQLAKAMKSVGKRSREGNKNRKLSTYEPADPRDSGMLGATGPDVTGVDTSKMAKADPKKFAARQAVQKEIDTSTKLAAGLLENSFMRGRMTDENRAPAPVRNALRQISEEIAHIAHIDGQPTPAEIFRAERLGRIVGSLLKDDAAAALGNVGASTNTKGKPLFSALLGAAVRASSQMTSEVAQQEKMSRDEAANQMVRAIPAETQIALMKKGVDLLGDENQRHFMLDGLESFFHDGEGPFTEKKLTAMLGAETLSKLKGLLDSRIEPRDDSTSTIDEEDANDMEEARAAEADQFVKDNASNAVDKSSPERLVFAHGRRDTTEDARTQFSRGLVGQVRQALKGGTGLTGVKLPSIARMPELDETGNWSAEDMLSPMRWEEGAKDIELPARGDDAGSTAMLPANSKLWRVAKYALDRFAGDEDAGEQPTHAVRLSSVGEELDAAGVHPNGRLDLMLGYLLKGGKINDADAKKLSRELRFARATKIALDKIDAVLTDNGVDSKGRMVPFVKRAEKHLQPERTDPAGKVIPSDLERAVSLLPEAEQAKLREMWRRATSDANPGVLPANTVPDATEDRRGLPPAPAPLGTTMGTRAMPPTPTKIETANRNKAVDQVVEDLDTALKEGGFPGSKAERMRTTLLALAKGLKAASDERSQMFKESLGLHVEAGDVDGAVKEFFNNRFQVVAEQKTNRDFDKMTSQDVQRLTDKAQGRMDAAEQAGIGLKGDEREQARRKVLAEEGTILFLKNGKEMAIRARDLANWSRNALFSSTSSKETDVRDKAGRKGYLNHMSQGIAALLDSGQADSVYTYGWDGRLGVEAERVLKWPLGASQGHQKQRRFPGSFPIPNGDGTMTTFGRVQYGRELNGPQPGDGRMLDPMERSLLDMAAAEERSRETAAQFEDGDFNKDDPTGKMLTPSEKLRREAYKETGDEKLMADEDNLADDGKFTRPELNDGRERDLEERAYLKRQRDIQWAAKTTSEDQAGTVPMNPGFEPRPIKGADGKFQNPSNPEVSVDPAQAKADQQRATWLRGEINRLKALHLSGGKKAEGVMRRIVALSRSLQELDARGKADAPATVKPSSWSEQLADPNAPIQVKEHSSSGYAARTRDNANAAGATVALAADFTSPGEKLTAKEAGERLLQIDINTKPKDAGRQLAEHMRKLGTDTLNVAGNGIQTLAQFGFSQARVNEIVRDVLAEANRIWPIKGIVSGGQTGVDIAGAVAAKVLGIPATITLPKGYRQRGVDGVDVNHTRAEIGQQIIEGAKALGWQPPAQATPTSVAQAAKEAAAQDSWNGVPAERKLSTYEPGDDNKGQERADPLTQPAPSDADLEAVRARLTRMLGDKIKVVFEKAFDAQGEWIEADKTIKLAITSIMPMLSTANHEALHAFFSGILANHAGARELLLKVATDPRNLDRIEAILAKGRDGNKAAIKSMRESPEEALAYTFQFWADGLLPIDSKPKGFFQKVQRFLREVFGLVRDSEKALDIFQALYDGKMAEPSAAQKALDGIMASGERGKQWRQKYDKQAEWLRSMTMTSHHMMRNSKSATMRDIAAKFFTNAGSVKLGTEPGILNRRDTAGKQWMTEFELLVEGLSKEDIASMAQWDNEHKWEDHPDPELNKRLKALYALTRRFREEYLLPAGIEMGMRDVQQRQDGSEDHRYTPMVWDVQTLLAEKDKFFAMLKKEQYKPVMDDMLKTMRQVKPDAEVDDVIDAIYQLLVDRNGVEEAGKIDAQREDGVLSPFFAAENVRKLDWIAQEDRGPFLNTDLIHKMSAYIHQGVRAAEYVRTWGPGGKALRNLLVREGDIIGFDGEGKPILADADGEVMAELREAAKAEKIPADQVEDWVQRRYEDETRAIGALEGVLGKDISENLRKLNSGLMAYQHARLLPLVIFASMLDPNNILVSGGKLDDMIYAYVRGMKSVWRTWKDLATGKELAPEKDRDALNAMAVGAIDNNVYLERKGEVQASEYLTSAAHRFNGKFFLYNGLTIWDRQMRIAATRAGMHFIERAVRGADKDSERKLKALGLTADQATLDKDGNLVVDPKALATQRAQKLAGAGWEKATPAQRKQWAMNQLAQAREDIRPTQEAVKRFVQRGVLSPNAAQRPAWGSDPHYAALFHLKSFTYSFQETVLTHVKEEMEAGNYRPGMQLLAGIPIMIAADITKALITGGGSLPGYMANWGVVDWVLHGTARAGLGGIGEIGANALEDPISLFGPMAEQVVDTAKDPGTRFGNLDMVPFVRMFKPGLSADMFDHADF